MSRFHLALIPVLLFHWSARTATAEPPARPAKYEVPFSAPQNFIDHAGAIKAKGSRTAVAEFHAVFDRPEEIPDPHLAVR